jgi:hypothetical protein
MNFSVSQYGLPLSPSKYTWDEEDKVFSSDENELVIDFFGIDGCKFNVGFYCTINAGYDCTFNTGAYCTINAEYNCVFHTGYQCAIVRRDIFEVYQTKPDKGFNIRLNDYKVPGFIEIEEDVQNDH